jgi:hypothetical protein
MTTENDAQFPTFRTALGRHVAGLRGLVGVDAFLREEGGGPWLGVARLGRVDPDRVEPALSGFDPAAGGSVEALTGDRAGWAASYMLGGPGLDLVLLFYLDGLAPGELQSQLSLIEAKVGWLMLAALSDRKTELGGVALSTEIGAQVLVDAAQARSRRLLADQWIARLEKALSADLIAVCRIAGGAPSLMALSGGGLVERSSDARSQIEALAAFGVRARAPQILASAPSGDLSLPDGAPEGEEGGDAGHESAAQIARQEALAKVEDLGGDRALVLPVYQGDDAAAVVVALWTPEATAGPLPVEGANLVAQVLGETLDIQARAFPSIWRRLGNWGWAVIVAVFGRTLWKLKLFVLILVLAVTALALTPTRFEPSFTARIEAQDRRIVSAPFDGFLSEAPFQLGDAIPPGALIVALEDSDLVLQIAQSRSALAEIEAGIQTARAQRDSAEVQALEAQRLQVEVELELLNRQQALARFEAGTASVVVGGDAWRRVGGRVRLGEPLLELAAPDSFRVLAFIDEDWVSDLAAGNTGELLLTAYPTTPLPVRLLGVTADPQLRDGVNTFPAWMTFEAPSDLALLDGMRGVVRIDAGETSMLAAYTRGTLRWVRRTLWRWG